MKRTSAIRSLLVSIVFATGSVAGTALAQVNVNIRLAPPAPQFETVPAVAPGHVWAPGYWARNGDGYVWIRGRQIVQRTGYRWEPDRWEERDGRHFRNDGRWERDASHRVVKVKKAKHHAHYDGHGHGKHKKHKKHKKHHD